MPKRPVWRVERDPEALRYAYFLSHVNEDRPVVTEVKAAIEEQSRKAGPAPLKCFLDIHDWPIANDLSQAMRELLLECQYMVLWITPKFLASDRGWVWMELAYAELLELTLNRRTRDRKLYYLAPVFIDVRVQGLERTPLLNYFQRGIVRPDEKLAVPAIADRLIKFFWQEEEKRRS
jgi:hypothetical protein